MFRGKELYSKPQLHTDPKIKVTSLNKTDSFCCCFSLYGHDCYCFDDTIIFMAQDAFILCDIFMINYFSQAQWCEAVDPDTRETAAGGLKIEGLPGLKTEFKASLANLAKLS